MHDETGERNFGGTRDLDRNEGEGVYVETEWEAHRYRLTEHGNRGLRCGNQ
jgi:hypothetical protein